MKKLAIIALAVAVSTVFAAKTPLEFAPGLKGFLGKYTQDQINTMVTTYTTNYPDLPFNQVTVVTFTGTTEKDTLQFTEISGEFSLEVLSPIKAISHKKLANKFYQIALNGGAKTQIKLPGFTIGTVLAGDVKAIQCLDIFNAIIIGSSPKGVAVKLKGNMLPANDVITLSGTFKSLAANKFGNVDATAMMAVAGKAGKLAVKAKVPMDATDLFTVSTPYQVKVLKKADKTGRWIKNINISPTP